jgi:hypothetical protein
VIESGGFISRRPYYCDPEARRTNGVVALSQFAEDDHVVGDRVRRLHSPPTLLLLGA